MVVRGIWEVEADRSQVSDQHSGFPAVRYLTAAFWLCKLAV